MRVVHVPCAPPVNESERRAFEHIKNHLQSLPGEDLWILLTNLAFSVTHQLQSDEIDIIAIGPQGARVVEVKHWTAQWIDAHQRQVEIEADRVTSKARKIGTTLRRVVSSLPQVEGAILFTQETKDTRHADKQVRGVRFHPLRDWQDAIGLSNAKVLTAQQITILGRTLEPKSGVAIDGLLRRLAGYINLDLLSNSEERFHRVYKGRHPTRRDRIVLHVYDLSATDGKNAEAKARREFEALHRLQLHTWAPRILDSYQEAPGYAGEMCFFTVVDPAAPSIEERTTDGSWTTVERLDFARNAVRAVRQLHQSVIEGLPIVHRNLTPKTILVRHDNSPILTGFDRTRIPSEVSVASLDPSFTGNPLLIPPEIRAQGLAAADCRSDIYSLCRSLAYTLAGRDDELSSKTIEVLEKGVNDDPGLRCSLEDLDSKLSELLGDSAPRPVAPPARFWTEEQVVRFRDRDYKIVSRLGSGGLGTAFKVVEIDRWIKEELGTYVGKVVHDSEHGERVLRSYRLARSHLGRHPGLSTIFEVARGWQPNDFVALMAWVEGTPLGEFTGVFPLLAEEQQETLAETLALRWIRGVSDALGVLHRNGLLHGDVSPRNLIVSGSELVLTDYDFITKIGQQIASPTTVLYCSPSYIEERSASPSDDIYALAASLFHVIFEKEPFRHGGEFSKGRGLSWDGIDRAQYPILAPLLDQATDPDPSRRFSSTADVLKLLKEAQREPISAEPPAAMPRIETPRELREQRVFWLLSLLQSFPGSR
jgi:serine/threonine protein kinase